jgi:transposase-like protein
MPSVLSEPYFTDEQAAFDRLEAIIWPDGIVCPHCGRVGKAAALTGVKDKKGRARIGLKKCYACRKQFTVRVGTVFEASHVPLHIWFQATFLMCSSKKGISSNQLHRTLGVTLKTAWFMSHRLREAMRALKIEPMGGAGKFVEADETFVGGKARNRAYREPPSKEAVMALVERGGKVASYHVPNVTAATLKPIIAEALSTDSHFRTDESSVYWEIGEKFASHKTVVHSANEYVRGDASTNTIEGYFSILKRGIYGVYQHVSDYHLKRYLAEFDFRYNERIALGIDDAERTTRALRGIVGKRLTYRSADETVEGRDATA